MAIPGTTGTYDLRAQNPHGAFGAPMLSLLQGHYPAGPGQVALTPGLARQFGLRVGSVWRQGGTTRTVTGIVQNPQSLLDEFALVVPGQVRTPTAVTVLFDAPGCRPGTIGPTVVTPQAAANSNADQPRHDHARAGHTGHAAHRAWCGGRLHRAGPAAAAGAGHAGRARRHRPQRPAGRPGQRRRGGCGRHRCSGPCWASWPGSPTGRASENSAHHLIGVFALPWVVIGPAMALAVLATYLAAWRPARAVTRIPVVAALSGRPAPPKQVHRSALPGIVLLAVAFGLFTYRRQHAAPAASRPRARPAALIGGLVVAGRGGDPAVPAVPGPAGPCWPAHAGRGPAGPA